jgi:hypothetical protein
MNGQTLITLSELAQRWGMSIETVRKLACSGAIRPALGVGRGQRFSIADVQVVERAGAVEADVMLTPLSAEGRGSPLALFARTRVAREAAGHAVKLGDTTGLEAVCELARGLLAMVQGGAIAVPPVPPVVGSRGVYAVRFDDPQAGQDLVRLAYAALASLTLAECCAALSDLGPRMRKKFEEELTGITRSAGGHCGAA